MSQCLVGMAQGDYPLVQVFKLFQKNTSEYFFLPPPQLDVLNLKIPCFDLPSSKILIMLASVDLIPFIRSISFQYPRILRTSRMISHTIMVFCSSPDAIFKIFQG
jgi:hypothetical protein